MALAFLNACIFRAASNGTGAFAPGSTITGYYPPIDCVNPAVVDGATYRYRAESDDLSQHEEGYGVWDDFAGELNRTVILSSSESGSIVDFLDSPKVKMGGMLAQDVPAWSVVSAGLIDTPVGYLDIELPDGFTQFQLEINGWVSDDPTYGGNTISVDFSIDGGSTFQSSDTGYFSNKWFNVVGANVVQSKSFTTVPINLATYSVGGTYDVSMMIRPGTDVLPLNVSVQLMGLDLSGPFYNQERGFYAAVTASARFNMLRLMPIGDGVNPPTDGSTVTSIGSYRLLGMR